MPRHIASRRIVSRLKAGRKAGLAAAAGTFGLPATAAGLAGLAGIPVLLGLGAVAVMAGLSTAYFRGRGQILPRNLIDEVGNTDAPYQCAFCTEATLAEACDLTKPHYRDEYVSATQAEGWRQKNPKAFVHLLNADGQLAASFGVLGLTPSFTDQFIKGNVTDLQLKAPDVLGPEQSKKAPKLYISGVVVRDPDSHIGHKRTAAMLWAMVRYLEVVYGVRRKRTLYAIAVTSASERLMKKLGFTLGCDGRNRRDRYHLYCFDLSPASWKTLNTTLVNPTFRTTYPKFRTCTNASI